MELEHEQQFCCPWCSQSISMLLDLSVPEQAYVEDCEVCCRPIEIHYQTENDAVARFEALPCE